ncbi:MAG: GAF domain-containing protein [Desulfobulbaceae bacterium]|nr:GAF domain-containing protein [Desulfobulbaceae bacterium]
MRKSFYITFALIAFALGSLLLLAFNQFKLYGQHENIIGQTEKFIFQYSIIREQIIEDVVTGNLAELGELSTAVEELHANIIKILDNSLIPVEYKFSFLQQIDLPGLILLLRKASTEKESTNILQSINQETRVIGERFLLFERLVLGAAKQKLVDFQLVIIGILALVVFLVIIFMVIMYRMLIVPVISLNGQAEEVLSGRQDSIVTPQGWQDIAMLSDKMCELLNESSLGREKVERYGRIVNCLQHVLGKIQVHCDKELLCKAVCRALLVNEDYILSWIGEADPEGKGILPLVADGSSTMSCDECQGCFAALFAEQEGEDDPALKALKQGKVVVMKDILAGCPRGPFKNTPLATGVVDSISLPLMVQDKKLGVLTIYAIFEGGILEEELELLVQTAAVLAAKLLHIELVEKMEMELSARNIIGEQNNIITFTLDKNGRILEVESYLETSGYKDAAGQWIGRDITDIIVPENDSERIILRKALEQSVRYDFNAGLAGFEEKFSATLEPTGMTRADKEILLLVMIPPQKNVLIQPENFQVAYSAAIGQFACSIAHEITDLSNGIINYAQMLSDELADEPRTERMQSLEKIIFEGEKVAAIVEPLLIDQDDFECSRSRESVQSIFKDALQLVGPLFKKDCIVIDLDVQSPSVQYRKQHLLLILLILLKRLRESLNDRYPQKNSDKNLKIVVSQYKDNSSSILLIALEFTGRECDYDREAIDKGEVAGMWLSQELARNLGGDLKISITEQEKIKVELLLPI